MTMKLRPAAVTVLVAALAACGGGGSESSSGDGSTATEGAASLPPCPVGAIDEGGQRVEITFWHAMTRANETALVELTDAFNGSQGDVRVKLVNQTSYDDVFTKYRAGLGSGDLPDLVQIEDTGLQLMVDSRSVLPAQSCVEATGYDLSDHIERVVDYYSVDDVLWPMPFNVSNPVFYYDRTLFDRAGLDPDDPPATFDEVRAASEAVVASGAADAGIALKLDAWQFEQWLALGGQTMVGNANGRTSRARSVAFDSPVGLEIFTWIDAMVDDDLAVVTGEGYDNLFAIGNGGAAMTIETSAALGTVMQVFSSGQYEHVELGVAPMPGPERRGGALVGGAALYIVAKSSPAEQEAAWRYAAYLNEPDAQAQWAAASGYVPIRKAAAASPTMTSLWQTTPAFAVAYEQLVTGLESEATAGPVIGEYQGVRDAVVSAMQSMVSQGVDPAKALADAARDANEAIESYNERIGA